VAVGGGIKRWMNRLAVGLVGVVVVVAIGEWVALGASVPQLEGGLALAGGWFGIGRYPSDGPTAGQLLRQADAQMYAVKAQRRPPARRAP